MYRAVVLFLAVLAGPVRAVWVQTWADEFNGAEGSSPTGPWKFEIGDGSPNNGWGNNELQYYTSSTENAVLDGLGKLNIIARKVNDSKYSCYYGPCQYTSARIKTQGNFSQTYGKFEARIKVPAGAGLWPAFWMLGSDIQTKSWPDCGEIDIMEIRGSNPKTVLGTIHGPGYSGVGISSNYTLPGGASFADDFHVFGVIWTEDSVTWLVDDQPYKTTTKADIPAGKPWVFNSPFFILLNLAVGGNFDGVPSPNLPFPQQLTIDYVRVYNQTNAV